MKNYVALFIVVLLFGCGGQTKEELTQEGQQLFEQGNYRGAIVLYKNALEKDANYLEARLGLANAYLDSGSYDRGEKEFQKILLQNPSRTDMLLKLAEIHIKQNAPDKALDDLERFHSSQPQTVESLVLHGRAYGLLHDLDHAENLFNKALSLDNRATGPRFNLAKVYLQKNDLDRAGRYLLDILAIDPNDVPTYYLLANVRMRQGDRDSALKAYQDLLQVDADQVQALYMSGVLLMDAGALDEAGTYVDRLLADFPERGEGNRLKGMLLYHRNDYEGARVVLENALQTEQHLLSYFFLGLSYYGLDQYELALNQFQRALDLSPEFERARILVSMTLLKQKRLDDAVIEIEKVLRKNPDNAYAHNILGSALLASGEYDRGMDELELATELDPGLADAHLKRGLFHLAKGEGALGEADLTRALDAAPEVMNTRLMLVSHHFRQKNYSEAIQLLKEGMDGSATDALLQNYLAAAYFYQKKQDLALQALEEAKKVNPDYLTPYFNIASYQASKSQYDAAIEEYERILTRDPANIRALLGIAALYNVKGEQAKIDDLYRRIEATGTEQGYVIAARYQLRKNNLDEAVAILTRGLEARKSSAPMLELAGLIHLQAERFAEAESDFTQLSGLNPEKGASLLVRLYLTSRQPDKAFALVADLLKKDSGREYPYLLSSGLLIGQKKTAEAKAVVEEGIGKVTPSLRLQMQLGRIYEIEADTLKAQNVYRRIIDAAPRYAPAYTSLGFLRERRGEKGDALELYRKAVKYDESNVPALNNIAYLLADNFGEEKDALQYALSAYRLQPSDPRVMDTLGYILVKNRRGADAVTLLEKAYGLLPGNASVALHLAQAKLLNDARSEAKPLLDFVTKNGTAAEVRQAEQLLNQM